jgi:Spy/CpxP family protein refolding chaperone
VCLGLLLAGISVASAQGPGGGRHGGGMRERGGGFEQPMTRSQPQPRMGPQLGLAGRWWDDHKTVKQLNLRPDQQQRMDSIFEANKPTLITLYSNLQREETHLASLPPADLQDETKVFAAIDRVSQASTDLEKEKVHILLQIRQQLDPTQVQALDQQIASVH